MLNNKFIFVVLILIGFIVNGYAADVGGIISSDTVWDLENSPYNLTEDIKIKENIILLIEPGVIIIGNNLKINVQGVFRAVGKAEKKIKLTNVNIIGGKEKSSNPSFIYIDYAHINGGSICKNFDKDETFVWSNLVLKNSLISSIPCLYLVNQSTDCYIERNIFKQCGGINVIPYNTHRVYIRNNTFYDVNATYVVKVWAKDKDAEIIVQYNNFLSNGMKGISVLPKHTYGKIYASYNYWGMIKLSDIEYIVHDYSYSYPSNKSYIIYIPALTELHPDVLMVNMCNKI